MGWLRPKPKAEDPLQACLRQHTELVTQVENLKKQVEQGNMLTLEISSLKAKVLTLEKDLQDKTERLNTVSLERDRLREKISKAQVALS